MKGNSEWQENRRLKDTHGSAASVLALIALPARANGRQAEIRATPKRSSEQKTPEVDEKPTRPRLAKVPEPTEKFEFPPWASRGPQSAKKPK